jgi:bifunctional DNase/RNase
MLEMVIDSIRVSLMNYQRVVILKERQSDRYLPIWIGSPEADSIAVKLQDVSVPRPLTHDLLGSVISELGANVDHVIVSDLASDTFFAKLVLQTTDGQQRQVDCRPSDAIAIAVRGGRLVDGPNSEDKWFPTLQEAQKYLESQGIDSSDDRYEVRSKVPIFVEEIVLEKAGVTMDNDTSNPPSERAKRPERKSRAPKPVTEDEMKKMSAFSEFLEDLPGLEELGGNPASES